MKPHITNLKHKKFLMLLEETSQKMAEIANEEKAGVIEKIGELNTKKQALEELYTSYQFKLKELSSLLDEYEKVQQASRIHLRKMQMWVKFGHPKLIKECS